MSSGDNDPKSMASQAMKDPAIMAAIQEKLAGLEGMRSTFYDALPKPIKNRVNACRNIQKSYVGMEAEFYNEINQLERKYHEKFSELYKKRESIVNGKYEPKEEECVHSGDEDEEDEESSEMNKSNGDVQMNEDGEAMIRLPSAFPDDAPGVPEFWLTVLKSAAHTDALIEPHDEEVLKHCTDVILKYEEEKTIEMADSGEEATVRSKIHEPKSLKMAEIGIFRGVRLGQSFTTLFGVFLTCVFYVWVISAHNTNF